MYLYLDSKSDLKQESYVISVLQEKKGGYYVELGSGDPKEGNNTLLLETKFDWSGLAIDSDPELVAKYNKERKNECIESDALLFDYVAYFKENNFPKQIDYLQVDIDGHDEALCLLALVALPMLQYRFSVITIEHDVCMDYKRASMRDAQREILGSLGYELSAQLLSEDWWVDGRVYQNKGEIDRHFMHPQYEGEK
jgi:hypothetical protein